MAAESKAETTTAMGIAVAAKGSEKQFVATEFEIGELGEFEVRATVLACGVCATDFATFGREGVVPGHEIVGRITAIGGAVKGLTIGDVVGMGFQYSACMACDTCVHGFEQSCSDAKNFWDKRGGYATQVVWDSRFTFKIPEGLKPTYTAMVNKGVKAGQRVAIVGIGGLGHLGIQFAKAFGCSVTALSRSADKEELARSLGAHEFVNTRVAEGEKSPLDAVEKFDFILSTVNADLDWNDLVKHLRVNGKLCLVGVPHKPVSFNIGPLIGCQGSVCASLIGSRASIPDMLRFAMLHNIKPVIETVPLTVDGAIAAVTKVKNNTARFRMVLVAEEE